MSDIFISYSSSDRAFAGRLAGALGARGWSVWWDRVIPAGKSYDDVIEEALDASACVLVLWSAESVKSGWVRTEAQEGLDRGVLVPILIEDVKPPLAFRRIQAADLIGWDGREATAGFERLLRDIEAHVRPGGAAGRPVAPRVEGGSASPAQRATDVLFAAKVKSIIATSGNVGMDRLTDDATLETLELDSLDVVELTMALEEGLHIDIPDGDLAGLRTLGDVIRYLRGRTR